MDEKITRLLETAKLHGLGYLPPESISVVVAAVVLADELAKLSN